MEPTEVVYGILLGILCGFFVTYSLQVQRPYPNFVLNMLYYPWMFAVIVLIGISFLWIDEKIAMLLLLIVLVFFVDIHFLGREKNPHIIEESVPNHYEYPINTNDITLFAN
jgi:hypothetical protein